jgi:hypothetical protein
MGFCSSGKLVKRKESESPFSLSRSHLISSQILHTLHSLIDERMRLILTQRTMQLLNASTFDI